MSIEDFQRAYDNVCDYIQQNMFMTSITNYAIKDFPANLPAEIYDFYLRFKTAIDDAFVEGLEEYSRNPKLGQKPSINVNVKLDGDIDRQLLAFFMSKFWVKDETGYERDFDKASFE